MMNIQLFFRGAQKALVQIPLENEQTHLPETAAIILRIQPVGIGRVSRAHEEQAEALSVAESAMRPTAASQLSWRYIHRLVALRA
jgi:hypothetical protein